MAIPTQASLLKKSFLGLKLSALRRKAPQQYSQCYGQGTLTGFMMRLTSKLHIAMNFICGARQLWRNNHENCCLSFPCPLFHSLITAAAPFLRLKSNVQDSIPSTISTATHQVITIAPWHSVSEEEKSNSLTVHTQTLPILSTEYIYRFTCEVDIETSHCNEARMVVHKNVSQSSRFMVP